MNIKPLGFIVLLSIFAVLICGLYLFWSTLFLVGDDVSLVEDTVSVDDKEGKTFRLPRSVHLKVPFTSQAPLGDWGAPFDHACEEASIIMADYYFKKKEIKSAVAAEEIKEIVEFEKKEYGFFEDTSSMQTAQLIRDYYGYEAEVRFGVLLEDIKEELAEGRLVIIPTNGQLLNNPYFSGDGPKRHMLLIVGYNSDGFIVNDPGTRRGEDFFYSYDIIDNALKDWDDQESRSMIVLSGATL